jgi:hypothetical protein
LAQAKERNASDFQPEGTLAATTSASWPKLALYGVKDLERRTMRS